LCTVRWNGGRTRPPSSAETSSSVASSNTLQLDPVAPPTRAHRPRQASPLRRTRSSHLDPSSIALRTMRAIPAPLSYGAVARASGAHPAVHGSGRGLSRRPATCGPCTSSWLFAAANKNRACIRATSNRRARSSSHMCYRA
jgi:hypothetical protein